MSHLPPRLYSPDRAETRGEWGQQRQRRRVPPLAHGQKPEVSKDSLRPSSCSRQAVPGPPLNPNEAGSGTKLIYSGDKQHVGHRNEEAVSGGPGGPPAL